MDVSKIIRHINIYEPALVVLCYDYKENNIQSRFKDDIKPYCIKNDIKLYFPVNDPHWEHIMASHFQGYKGKNSKEFLLKNIKKHKKIMYDEIAKKGGSTRLAKTKCPKSIMKYIRGD